MIRLLWMALKRLVAAEDFRQCLANLSISAAVLSTGGLITLAIFTVLTMGQLSPDLLAYSCAYLIVNAAGLSLLAFTTKGVD